MASKQLITRFKWTLGFDKLSANCHCSEEVLESEEFSFKDTKFQLKLTPKVPYNEEESNEDEANHISLYLVVKDWAKHEELEIKCRLWLEDDENRMISLQKKRERTFKKENYHWTNACFEQYYEEFMNSENYPEPEEVTFFCEMYHELDELEQEANEFRQKLCLYGEKGILGRCIIANKEKHFGITKPLLMLHSQAFENMFMSDSKEARSGVFKLEVISADAVQVLISYFNTGKIEKLEKYAEELFIFSDMYQIKKLQNECVDYLVSSMDKFNSFNRLKTAFIYNNMEFREKCLNYVTDPDNKGNFGDIFASKEWKKFSFENDATSTEISKAVFSKKGWISKKSDF